MNERRAARPAATIGGMPCRSSRPARQGVPFFLQNDFRTASQVLAKAYQLSQSINIGVRLAKSLYMQGSLPEFSHLLQQLQQNHPNDPQLQPLNSLLLPQHLKKS